jgi:hypothetical protein
VIWAAISQPPVAVKATVAGIVAVHVLFVWMFRFEWDWARATRNGYAGFTIFHVALLLIVMAPLLRAPFSTLALRSAFLIATAGALGAVFRYDEVAVYRIPVIAGAAAGVGGIAFAIWRPRTS